MKVHTRRKLFLLFLFLFVLASVGVVYYTQGYRFDFQTKTLTRTGSLYLEVAQRPVHIYLNDKEYKDESGLLKKGTLISSILPKKYRILIKKDGFHDYEKNVEIKPLQVTRLFHVTLVPARLQPQTVFVVQGLQKIIASNLSGKLLVSTKTDPYVLLDTHAPESPVSITPYLSSLSKKRFKSIGLQPEAADVLVADQNGILYAVRMATDAVSRIIPESYARTISHGALLFGLNPPATSPSPSAASRPSQKNKDASASATTTSISVYDTVTGSKLDAFAGPFPPASVADADGAGPYYAFLLSNGDLWIRQNGSFEKIAHDAAFVSFSPDEDKLLFRDSKGAAFVYVFQDELEALDIPKGTTVRLNIQTQSLQSMQWYDDSYHFILGYPDRIVFAEFTRSEPNSQTSLRSGIYSSFIYSPFLKSLFVSADNAVEHYDLSVLE